LNLWDVDLSSGQSLKSGIGGLNIQVQETLLFLGQLLVMVQILEKLESFAFLQDLFDLFDLANLLRILNHFA
jgi:hypothetical protein